MPAAFSKLLGWLATLVIFLAGLFFAVLALGGHLQLLEARKVMAQGQPVEGTVTGLRRGTGKSASYYFSYEFPAAGMMRARKDAGISYSDHHELRQGSKIKVWYDPANPANSVTTPEMAEFESIPNRLFLPGVALLLLGWWVTRLVRRRPAPPAPPASPATPEPTRYVSPVRRGE
jgi:uncharacterized protein DUF3592